MDATLGIHSLKTFWEIQKVESQRLNKATMGKDLSMKTNSSSLKKDEIWKTCRIGDYKLYDFYFLYCLLA